MHLRVKGHVELPHKLTYKGKDYEFAPFAEVPDALGEALLKNQSQHYEPHKPGTKVSMKGYTFKESYKKETFMQKFSKLTTEAKAKVEEMMDKLLEGLEDETNDEKGKGPADDPKIPADPDAPTQ